MHLYQIVTSVELEIEMDERETPKKKTEEGRQTERRENQERVEKDQDRDPWSLLVDLYTRKTRFEAEPELSNES
jgi:hypothetical protein